MQLHYMMCYGVSVPIDQISPLYVCQGSLCVILQTTQVDRINRTFPQVNVLVENKQLTAKHAHMHKEFCLINKPKVQQRWQL